MPRSAIATAETSVVDFRYPFTIAVSFDVTASVPDISLWIRIANHIGDQRAVLLDPLPENVTPGSYVARAEIPGDLLIPGRYFLDVGAEHYRRETLHYALSCGSFEIANTTTEFEGAASDWGLIMPKLAWQVAGTATAQRCKHHGARQ